VRRSILVFIAALSAVVCAQNPGEPTARMYVLSHIGDTEPRLQVRVDDARLSQPQFSPKHKFQFDYITAGYGRSSGAAEPYRLKFRVFSQYKKATNDLAQQATITLCRLWDLNSRKLQIDHSEQHDGIVDVYLCFGGKPGGEQLFDSEERNGIVRNVNTVYVYDVSNLNDPLETLREIAHEYGHASLPGVGNYREPEAWANGHLGERLFLRWLHQALTSKRLGTLDTCGADEPSLAAYLSKNVKPLVDKVLTSGPVDALIDGKSSDAMNHYLGLMLLAESVLPAKTFAMALKTNDDSNCRGALDAMARSVGDLSKWQIDAANYVGTRIWLPIGNGTVVGGTVLARKLGWAKVDVQSKNITIAPVKRK